MIINYDQLTILVFLTGLWIQSDYCPAGIASLFLRVTSAGGGEEII